MQKIRVFCSVVKTLNTSFCMKILFCKVTNITYKKLSASSRFDCPHSNTTHSFLTIGSGIKKGFSKSQSSTCFQLVFFFHRLYLPRLLCQLIQRRPRKTPSISWWSKTIVQQLRSVLRHYGASTLTPVLNWSSLFYASELNVCFAWLVIFFLFKET